MNVKFFCGIGFAGAEHEETFQYPDDTSEQELNDDAEAWMNNYLNWGYYKVEETV